MIEFLVNFKIQPFLTVLVDKVEFAERINNQLTPAIGIVFVISSTFAVEDDRNMLLYFLALDGKGKSVHQGRPNFRYKHGL